MIRRPFLALLMIVMLSSTMVVGFSGSDADLSLQTDADNAARIGDQWFNSLEDALGKASSGDRVVLEKDYLLGADVKIPSGVTLLLPCMDDDPGYGANGYNPDGGSRIDAKLYRQLTVSADAVIEIHGTLLVNAVTGVTNANTDKVISGGYSEICLNGKIMVKDGGVLDVCGKVVGDGEVNGETGSEIRDLYVVNKWRGGSQAAAAYKVVYPYLEYDCNNIRSTLVIQSGSSYLGTVKMYASSSYYYTRFPQIDNSNGLIRLAENAVLIKTYDSENERTTMKIIGGASFGSSALNLPVVGELSTHAKQTYWYPLDGDISLYLDNGRYDVNERFKLMPGAELIISDAELYVATGAGLMVLDRFIDESRAPDGLKPIPQVYRYPDRPPASMVLRQSHLTLEEGGQMGGSIWLEGASGATIKGDRSVTIKEATELTSKSGLGALFYTIQVEELTRGLLIMNRTVSFDVQGGGAVPDQDFPLDELPVPVRAGYDFIGWFINGTDILIENATSITADMISEEGIRLYAKWIPRSNSIGTDVSIKHGDIAVPEKAATGETVEFRIFPHKGYAVRWVYMNGILLETVNGIYSFTMPPCDAVISVTLERYAHYVSFDDQNGGLIEMEVEIGSKAQKPPDPIREGYDFKGWFLGRDPFDFDSEVTGDMIIKARWTKVMSLRTDDSTVTITHDGTEEVRIEIYTSNGQIMIPPETVNALISGKGEFSLTLDPTDPSELNDQQRKALLKDCFLFRIDLVSENGRVHELLGNATVRLQYVLPQEVSAESICLWYVGEDGTLHKKAAFYDASEQAVVFETDHFSYFMIAADMSGETQGFPTIGILLCALFNSITVAGAAWAVSRR